MNKNRTITNRWWHDEMTSHAAQLSKGVLTEMKRRVQTSNIQKEKLQLNKNTERPKQFFERDIKRYTKRKEATQLKEQQLKSTDNAASYQSIIRKLLTCNESLSKKCKYRFISGRTSSRRSRGPARTSSFSRAPSRACVCTAQLSAERGASAPPSERGT
jgi:hypothetical protein